MTSLFNFIKAVILGIIQGITEWLPISSTAHLILFENLLSFKNVSDGFFNIFRVVIQLGSIIAVVVLYFTKLFPYKKPEGASYGNGVKKDTALFFKSMGNDKPTWLMWFKIALACVPAAIVGYFLEDAVDSVLSTPFVIAMALIVYGFAFLWLENTKHTVSTDSIEKLSFSKAFFIGCFQTLALIPGTSRSGSTILGATILGTSRTVAAEFSFFLAIPVMFGASFLKLLHGAGGLAAFEWMLIFVGFIVSFIVSVFAIKFFIDYIKKHSFVIFGWYRILLGIVILFATGFAKLI